MDDLKRDSQAWFEDGNIIVVAEGTAFQVHRSTVLSLRPDVLLDMLSNLPVASTGTKYCGLKTRTTTFAV